MAPDHPSLADALVTGVQDQVGIVPLEPPAGELGQARTQPLVDRADARGREAVATQLLGDRLHLPRRGALHVHRRQGRDQGPLGALVALEPQGSRTGPRDPGRERRSRPRSSSLPIRVTSVRPQYPARSPSLSSVRSPLAAPTVSVISASSTAWSAARISTRTKSGSDATSARRSAVPRRASLMVMARNLGSVGDREHRQQAVTARHRRLLQNPPHYRSSDRPSASTPVVGASWLCHDRYPLADACIVA